MSVLLVTCPLRECLEGRLLHQSGEGDRIENTFFCPKTALKC